MEEPLLAGLFEHLLLHNYWFHLLRAFVEMMNFVPVEKLVHEERASRGSAWTRNLLGVEKEIAL